MKRSAYALTCALLSSTAPVLSVTSHAQTSAPTATDETDVLIVTGTRRSERSASDASAPVDVIGNNALRTVSSPDLADQLTRNVPSFNVQRMPGLVGASFVRPASLRGLSPDETLVLVNGKRRHRTAYVNLVPFGGHQAPDLAQIPTGAIARVEVLRDGAAAQYGSDAIAGVVNILLEDKPGFSGLAEIRESYEGDGLTHLLSARGGVALSGGGSLTVTGEYSDTDYSSRNGTPSRVGLPKSDAYRLFYNLSAPISDGIELYSFGSYSYTDAANDAAYRSTAIFVRSYYQDHAPFIAPDFDFKSIYPNGFVPSFQSKTDDYSLVAGLRGNITSDLTWDLSGRYGHDRIRYRITNTINLSLGPNSPTSFHAGSQSQTETGVNLDLNYSLDAGLAKPVNVAFGGEYRTERFKLHAGEPGSYAIGVFADLQPGAAGYPGTTPDQAGSWGRHSGAAYLDVDTDLTERLNLGAAVRYEDYSDFGDTANSKLSGRYKVTEFFNVRGAVSTGFRAPTPGQSHITTTQQNPDASSGLPPPFPIVTLALLPPSNPIAQYFGAQPLKAEKSTNYSLGFVLKPLTGFSLTADIYRIDVRDRIGLLPFTRITSAQRALFVSRGIPGAAGLSQIRFFVNGLNTRTQGIDIVATAQREVDGANLGLTLAYNHNVTKVRKSDARFDVLETYQYYEHHLPRDTLIATATIDIERFSLLARTRHYGTWIDVVLSSPLAAQNQRVGSEIFFDLSATYRVSDAVSVSVGAENLLDNYPDRKKGFLATAGTLWPVYSVYDKDGGRYFARLAVNF
ncbi:TonB-dependent receptor plug domain-containing protein [Novosphingobium sp. BL-52-GroH]|uniref:TonB-dependent receptor plug domain-containing protein n=1 Tax=Novosphingobium sp. BL-52-GroH TaxID=3349877 RepID=UPI00384BF53F